MNGARALLESLKAEGVEVVFGYPGGAVLTLYDEVYKMKFSHILTRHEQGAAHAADGYARASGKVGVAFATSGPGATNLVTGIATAHMDSVPMVCITGQVANPYIGKDSFQEADIVGITTPITKHNYLVKDVNDIPRVVKEAFYIARTGRPGVVVIDVAKDVFDRPIEYCYPEMVELHGYTGDVPYEVPAVWEAVEALAAAHRPLLFVGGGVVLSDTSEYVRELLTLTGMPSVATLMGIGSVPAETEGYTGMAGMHGAYASNMAIQECDLLIALGTRFSDRVTGNTAAFAPKAKIVHFDIDPAEFNKNVCADISVIGDLRETLPAFLDVVKNSSTEELPVRFRPWRGEVLSMERAHPLGWKASEDIRPEELISRVRELVPQDAICVTDVGQHQMWAAQFFGCTEPRHFLTSGGLGTMGYGLPAAIGAKLAHPDKEVVLITGDGSIMMNCQELATMADNDIDVKIVIVHNSILGMVGQWQRLFYSHHYSASELKGKTDFVKLAEAMGVAGCRIETREEFAEVLPQALRAKGARLIDVIVPQEADVVPMVPGGKRLDQMVLGGR
ncbi:acetolactate synthase [Selenomonas infelix ATCC 43532]|uniref:Acetolactate synthase n=1 Tax=Selenomonas infelix ATCC 43532 TaxID=679201 RepID=G5GQ17_9FIRM|nr:biosynthetic-type acetolactate synthase large subunit [Selenomonas infelix]EHG20452.1 acetolactate synthase [Selenomonas infelix ATCC 43532]